MKKIFISYSDHDRSRMRQLKRIINKEKFFNAIVIADKRNPQKQLSEKVKDGISESDYFIPIITSNSINTQWINQEIGFATALEKNIIPVIDLALINQLKGFIHKNIDLPYSFADIDEDVRKKRRRFRKTCKLLINDLLIKNNYIPSSLDLISLFPGKWKSEFNAKHIKGYEFPIEIKDGDRYFAEGKHLFNIEEFSFNRAESEIRFFKVGLGDDKRRIKNVLLITKLGEIYEGNEFEQNEKIPIKIVYTKM